jgi:hypothetical protein
MNPATDTRRRRREFSDRCGYNQAKRLQRAGAL